MLINSIWIQCSDAKFMFINKGQDVYIMDKKPMAGLLPHHGGRLAPAMGVKGQ